MAEKQAIVKPAGHALLAAVESAQLRSDVPEIRSGDTVRLQVKVVEGNKERLQPFEGVVIRVRGAGINKNFTVRRVTNGVGVERTFLLHSPRVDKIEVEREGSVRRTKLTYLRHRLGKGATLVKEREGKAEPAAAEEKK